MRTMAITGTLALVGIILAACDLQWWAPDGENGRLTADIRGDRTDEFRGSASFDVYELPEIFTAAGSAELDLLSVSGRSTNQGVPRVSISAFRDAETAGNYRIVAAGEPEKNPGSAHLSFSRISSGGVVERYMATSGEVTISHIDAEEARGRFEATAILYCEFPYVEDPRATGFPEGGCPLPDTVPEDVTTIEISGSFEAVPPVTRMLGR